MKQNLFLRFFLVFKSFISVIFLNVLIIYSKIRNRKIFFFYYPRNLVTGNHTYVIEDLFKPYFKNSTIIFGHKAHHLKLKDNYFYIKESFLKLILPVDIFMSTAICDQFINRSKKIYINHHIYDSPMVSPVKERKMCERLIAYDIIFVASKYLDNLLKDLFKRHLANQNSKVPELREIGYPRFDYLKEKIEKLNINIKDKKSVLVSPTNIDSDPNFSLYNDIDKILKNLVSKTDFEIIFRPHPMNRFDERILKIIKLFENNKNFFYDNSDDYTRVYSRSFCMIADHSDTAYMFPFLTLCPVIFYSNDNLKRFLNSEEKDIKSLNYRKLNYFNNRDKIGFIMDNFENFDEIIQQLKKDYSKYENSILSLRNEIKYLGRSKEQFYKEIENILSLRKI